MKKPVLISFISFLTVLTLFTQSVSAQTTTPSDRQQKRQDALAQRCTNLTTQIDTRIARYNNDKQKHIDKFNKMRDKLKAIGDKLKAAGYNTSKLDADWQTMGTKIQKFTTDFDAYITDLTNTKSFVCGQSEGQYKSALQTARQALGVVHTDVVDIKNFYQTVVRADMQALKAQKPSITPSQ